MIVPYQKIWVALDKIGVRHITIDPFRAQEWAASSLYDAVIEYEFVRTLGEWK